MKRLVACAALFATLAGCSSIGIGVGIPIGRHGGISVGGSIPLPPPSSRTGADAPAAPASAASRPAAR